MTYIWASNDTGDGKLMCRKNSKWDVWGGGKAFSVKQRFKVPK